MNIEATNKEELRKKTRIAYCILAIYYLSIAVNVTLITKHILRAINQAGN